MQRLLREQAYRFAENLKDTEEYIEYQRQKEKLRATPEYLELANRIRLDHLKLLQSQGDNEIYGAEKAFASEWEGTLRVPEIRAFLDSEAAFCRLIRETLDLLLGELEV